MCGINLKYFVIIFIILIKFPTDIFCQQICGITLDSLDNNTDTNFVNNIKNSLRDLPKKPTVRIVFNPDNNSPLVPNPGNFNNAVNSINSVSFVLGQVLDSWYWDSSHVKGYNHDNIIQRTRDFLSNDTLNREVSIWELGNEINGEWLFNGNIGEVQRTVYDAVLLAKSFGKNTAITFFYNTINCIADSSFLMDNWISCFISRYPQITSNLNYVFISYYYYTCQGVVPDWANLLNKIHNYFPNSKVGIGECGWKEDNSFQTKLNIINSFYGMNVHVPFLTTLYLRGNFYWTYMEDCVQNYASNALWLGIRNNVVTWSSDTTVGIKNTGISVKNFNLDIYPNPFNPTTNIKYSIPASTQITIKIFDLTGRLVKLLYSGYKNSGTYFETFDASNYASGIYFLQIESGINIATKKLAFIK